MACGTFVSCDASAARQRQEPWAPLGRLFGSVPKAVCQSLGKISKINGYNVWRSQLQSIKDSTKKAEICYDLRICMIRSYQCLGWFGLLLTSADYYSNYIVNSYEFVLLFGFPNGFQSCIFWPNQPRLFSIMTTSSLKMSRAQIFFGATSAESLVQDYTYVSLGVWESKAAFTAGVEMPQVKLRQTKEH